MDIIIKIIQFFLCFTIAGIGDERPAHGAGFQDPRRQVLYLLRPWFSIFKFKRGDTSTGWAGGGYCKIAGFNESMDKNR